MEAYSASIDRGLLFAQQMVQLADSVDRGLEDAQSELKEWL